MYAIEPSFRDSKDLRFGMGMSALRIDDPKRRDRLLLLNAFAILLLTILGAAGESLGMDRLLRTSTVKRRVHSLFRLPALQSHSKYAEARLRPLIERYANSSTKTRHSPTPSGSHKMRGYFRPRAGGLALALAQIRASSPDPTGRSALENQTPPVSVA